MCSAAGRCERRRLNGQRVKRSVLRLLKQKKHFIPTRQAQGQRYLTVTVILIIFVFVRLDSTFDA